MTRRPTPRTSSGRFAAPCLTFALLALLALAPAAAVTAADGFPAGSVAFFNKKTCPEGWDTLEIADGRLVASLMPGGGNGAQVGTALSDQEDRKHSHKFSSSIKPSEASYVLIGGCCNDSLAKHKTYDFNGTTDKVSSGLPYVQLLMCQKVAGGETKDVPKGLLMYSSGFTCPKGFSQPLTLQGRFFIGLPDNGSPGISFGGPALSPSSSPIHSHEFSGSASLEHQGIAGASGCCASGYAKKGSYDYSGNTDSHSVDLPFVQFLNCVKD